jgi:hypothetical protein
MILDDFPQYINIRVSMGLENPGKSLNWKKNSRTGKSLKISRSRLKVLELISLTSSCANISDFD